MDLFGIGSIVSTVIGSLMNLEINESNQDFSSEEAQKQREWSEKMFQQESMFNRGERIAAQDYNTFMWNQTNEYNRPSAQMERLVSAGINPNNAAASIAGGSPASLPAGSPADSASVPSGASASAPSMLDVGSPFASMFNQAAQGKAALAQSKLSDEMAQKTKAETEGIVIDNDYKPFEKDMNLQLADQKIRLMVKQGELSEEQANQLRELTPLLKSKTAGEIKQLFNSAALLAEQKENAIKQRDLLSQQIESERHRQKLMDAQAREAYFNSKQAESAIELNGVRMSLTAAEARLKVIEGNIKKNDNTWRNFIRQKGLDPDAKGIAAIIDMGRSSVISLKEKLRSIFNKQDIEDNTFSWSDMDLDNETLQYIDENYKSSE